MSKRLLILEICKSPIQWKDLREKIGYGDRGLSIALKKFVEQGWLQKVASPLTPDNPKKICYETTAEGREILDRALKSKLSFVDFMKLPNRITVNELGVEGGDGDIMLWDIAQAVKRYVGRHSEPFVITVQVGVRRFKGRKSTFAGKSA